MVKFIYRGPFLKYVKQILPIIDHQPTSDLWRNFFIVKKENLHIVITSSTTYLTMAKTEIIYPKIDEFHIKSASMAIEKTKILGAVLELPA